MKYTFISVDRYSVANSTVETISESTLMEYLKAFPKEECYNLWSNTEWTGYDSEEYTYLWKKLAL